MLIKELELLEKNFQKFIRINLRICFIKTLSQHRVPLTH